MAGEARRGFSWKRWLGMGLAGVFLLLGLAWLVVPRLIPWDKLKTEAEQKLTQTLHHRVSLGEIKVSGLMGVEIRRLRVENRAGFSSEPLLADDALIVRYRLLPLLWGQVALQAIELHEPRVRLERSAQGDWNFSDMLSASQSSAVPAPPAAKQETAPSKAPMQLPVDLLIGRFVMTRAALIYQDHGKKRDVRIEDFNLAVRNLSLAGLAPVQVELGTKIKTEGLEIPWQARATFRFQYFKERLVLENLQTTLPGVEFQARGGVETFFSKPAMDFRGALKVDLARAVDGLVPADMRGKLGKATGLLNVPFEVRGSWKELGALQGTVETLADVKLGFLQSVWPLRLEGKINLRDARLDLSEKLSLPGMECRATVSLDDFLNRRVLDAKLDGRMDLAQAVKEASALAPGGKNTALNAHGGMNFSARAAGPVSEWKKLTLGAEVKARDLTASFQGQTLLEKFFVDLALTPQRIRLSKFSGKLAGHAFQAEMDAKGFDLRNPESLRPDRLQAQVTWKVNSERLDLAPWMALIPEKPAAAASSAKPAAPSKIVVLPEPDARALLPAGLSVQGTASLGGLQFKTIKLGKLEAKMELKKRVLSLPARLQGYQGSIQSQLRLDFSQAKLGYAEQAEVKNVDLEPLLNDVVDGFVAAKWKKPELIAELKSKITGRLSGRLALNGSGMARSGIQGKGDFQLTGGRIRKMAFQDQLAQWAGSDRWKQDMVFDNTVLDFTLAGEKVNLLKFTAESGPKGDSGDLRLTADGILTFDANFENFHCQPHLSPRSTINLSPEFRSYSEVLKDEKGWVTLPLVMNGPISKPDVKPDLKWIQAQAGGYAQKKVKAAADQAGQKVQSFVEQQKGKSAQEVQRDVSQELEKAKEKLQNLNFQNLFK